MNRHGKSKNQKNNPSRTLDRREGLNKDFIPKLLHLLYTKTGIKSSKDARALRPFADLIKQLI